MDRNGCTEFKYRKLSEHFAGKQSRGFEIQKGNSNGNQGVRSNEAILPSLTKFNFDPLILNRISNVFVPSESSLSFYTKILKWTLHKPFHFSSIVCSPSLVRVLRPGRKIFMKIKVYEKIYFKMGSSITGRNNIFAVVTVYK